MATEELNGIENTIKKEAEFFFKKYEIEETKDVPSNFLYYPKKYGISYNQTF